MIQLYNDRPWNQENFWDLTRDAVSYGHTIQHDYGGMASVVTDTKDGEIVFHVMDEEGNDQTVHSFRIYRGALRVALEDMREPGLFEKMMSLEGRREVALALNGLMLEADISISSDKIRSKITTEFDYWISVLDESRDHYWRS
jgi:hypothetical protein